MIFERYDLEYMPVEAGARAVLFECLNHGLIDHEEFDQWVGDLYDAPDSWAWIDDELAALLWDRWGLALEFGDGGVTCFTVDSGLELG